MIDFNFEKFQITKGFAATFVLDNSEQTHVSLCFGNKKQSCLILPSNLCGIVAQHDDLDWIKYLSNFGMVVKSTTQLWILGVQPSGKVCKGDKTKHQRIWVGQKFIIMKPFVKAKSSHLSRFLLIIFVNFSWKVERFFWCSAYD